ncbi:MAG TPA: 2-amino-4-hydroxy-6-hydroxymethyldihydropteridine diphosphokinase [Novosphingobium sp.]
MQRYLIALGSNRPHPRAGAPRAVLAAALGALDRAGLAVAAAAPVALSRPLGPSQRTYANAAALVDTAADPPELLAALQRIERAFGRIRRGRRWGARVLDLDIVLWSGGRWSEPGLTVPHPHFRARTFVLGPARSIAGAWRDPLTGLTLRQLHARLTRPRPLPKSPQR